MRRPHHFMVDTQRARATRIIIYLGPRRIIFLLPWPLTTPYVATTVVCKVRSSSESPQCSQIDQSAVSSPNYELIVTNRSWP